jgi:hypothetical protein
MKQKCVGLIPSHEAQIHFLDHLAVICHVLDAPLLLIKELEFNIAKTFYPEVDIRFMPYEEFSSDYLVSNFDVLILSDLWSKAAFHEKYDSLEKKYGKTLRHMHCPHGFSDKGYYLHKCAYEDILLVYGLNMLDLLKYYGVSQHLSHYAITGNYRYSYYKKHQAFYKEIINKEVLTKFDKERPLILYAPTWQDSDQATTFFDVCSNILDLLPKDYNMVVKTHPRLEWDDPTLYYQILRKYKDKKNILFLNEFPLVYPLLDCADMYIGDMSAIGYDYLVFNKPMFFLNTKGRNLINDRTLLYSCGVEIFPDQMMDIYTIIADSLSSDKERYTQFRQVLYDYTFGAERSFAEIKEDVNNCLLKRF